MIIDFKVLTILNTVIECKSVTLAAQQLHTSPSSITYAINKLRKITTNPILIRNNTGVTPTALAIELNERYRKAVEMLNEGVLGGVEGPESISAKKVTISTYAFIEFWLSFLAVKKASLLASTPLNFSFHPPSNDERLIKLRNREIDIDIGAQLPNDPSIASIKLYSSKYKVMTRKDHSTIRDSLSKAQWNSAMHVTWNRVKEETFAAMGISGLIPEVKNRNVGIMTYSSANMLMLSATSDVLTLVPEYFNDFICEIMPVKTFDIPFENNMESTIYLHYHIGTSKDKVVMQWVNTIGEMAQT